MEAYHNIGLLTNVANICVLTAQNWKLWARLKKSLHPQITNFNNQVYYELVFFLISQGTSSSYFLTQHIYVNRASSYSYISYTEYIVSLCFRVSFFDDQIKIAESLGFFCY